MSNPIFEINFSPKQKEAFNFLHDRSINIPVFQLCYGGAKGGGKSCFGVRWVYFFCKWLIKTYDLKPQKYPLVVGFMGRKRGTDFSSSTLQTWKRDIPSEAYEIKTQEHLIVIENTVAVQYGGLDDSTTIQKFNSAEYIFIWIDQPDECTQGDIGKLRITLRQKINGQTPPYKVLLTPNPVVIDDPDFMWLKEEFIDNPSDDKKYLQALYLDNPYLPDSYGKNLEDSLKFNPALLKAYKEGDWSQVGIANVVIPRQSVELNIDNIMANNLLGYDGVKKVTACDVASGGDDETVIYDSENTKIVNQEIYCHKDEMDTVGRIVAHATKNQSSVIVVDIIGVGAGVYSRLKEIYRDQNSSIYIYGYDSRVNPPDGLDAMTYHNWRAYAWFNASKKYFAERKCNIPNDKILISQLSSQRFKFHSNGKMILESKEDMIDSPDRADNYIMLLDGLRFAKNKVNKTTNEVGWQNGNFIPQDRYAMAV